MRCRLLRALFFSPFLCLLLLSFLYGLGQLFSPLFLGFSPEPHMDLKSSKEWRGSLPQLGMNNDSEEHIIDRLLLGVHCENFYIYSTWLIWWKTAESHLKCRFFYFPQPLSPNGIPNICLIVRFTYWLLWLRIWAIPTQLFWQHGESWQGHGDLAWRAKSYMKIFLLLVPFSWSTMPVFLMCWPFLYVRIS